MTGRTSQKINRFESIDVRELPGSLDHNCWFSANQNNFSNQMRPGSRKLQILALNHENAIYFGDVIPLPMQISLLSPLCPNWAKSGIQRVWKINATHVHKAKLLDSEWRRGGFGFAVWYLFASGFSFFDQFLCGFSVTKVACGLQNRRKNQRGFSVRDPFFHRFFGFFAAICLISFYIIGEFKNHSQQP